MNRRFDFAVIGGGMAGASLAAEVAGAASLVLLEAESQPGYHSTGRSAAFWAESYGGPLIQPLTAASRPFLAAPPLDFCEHGFLGPRGAIHLADAAGRFALDRLAARFAGSPLVLEPLGRAALEAAIPGLRQGWDFGLSEPSCADIDVASLHAAYLKRARVRGAELLVDARVEAAERGADGWTLETTAGEVRAGILVNAAGAWADRIASLAGERPVGIAPYRRTIAQIRVTPAAPQSLPLVIEARARFYFKPEAGGRLWLSPHDETLSEPGDCAAEEIDVATAIDRFGQAVDWRVERVERRWAGLRSFAPDRLPVFGFGAGRRDFFWFAGQGGFGIQTAPAAAAIAGAMLLGRTVDPAYRGIDPEHYTAARFS